MTKKKRERKERQGERQQADANARVSRTHTARDREKVCGVCGEEFTAKRVDAKTCSPACKQKAYRRRRAAA